MTPISVCIPSDHCPQAETCARHYDRMADLDLRGPVMLSAFDGGVLAKPCGLYRDKRGADLFEAMQGAAA